ncbi:MAG: glycoside hydrolase family 32 protein [Bernardetiaceae bacterium]|nr:glycoside hydrolase family 32 protein [Bernardetiaceae bacterium]
MKTILGLLGLPALAAWWVGCGPSETSQTAVGETVVLDTATEHWRPRFHFAPPRHWTNDPNGLVYFQGEYHLFYQHNPFDKKWGHMSWGHAVSKNLLDWEHLPVAIAEDTAMIFSGSAVVDTANLSGFATGPGGCLVAIYTAHRDLGGGKTHQTQHIAYSNDRGRTFTKYAGNPVLDLQQADFRDPDVFWHAPTRRWIMVVQLPQPRKTLFYASNDLKKWTKLSEFGPAGNPEAIWECPELVQLPVENEPGQQKWVYLLSAAGPYPGYQGMQYFVGEFDGTTFRNEYPADQALYVDYGRDFYAAIGYNHLPDDRRIIIGWMANWAYAGQTPAHPWRHVMSIPRELALRRTPAGYRLVQRPVRELAQARPPGAELDPIELDDEPHSLDGGAVTGRVLDLELAFEQDDAQQFGLRLFEQGDQYVEIGYLPATGQLYLDRSRAGVAPTSERFSQRDSAAVPLTDRQLKLRVLIDRSTVEVFAQDGQVVLSNAVFPLPQQRGVSFFAKDGTAWVKPHVYSWGD